MSIPTAAFLVRALVSKGRLERRMPHGGHRNIALPGDGLTSPTVAPLRDLTTRREACLEWFTDYYARHRKSPTMDEIGKALGIKNSSATALCQALVERGYLERYKPEGKHRNLRPVVQAPRKARVLQLFKDSAAEGLDAPTVADVSILFGVSVWDARSILRDLVEDGSLERNGDDLRLSTEAGPRSPSPG